MCILEMGGSEISGWFAMQMQKLVVSEGPSQTAAAATNTQESVIALI